MTRVPDDIPTTLTEVKLCEIAAVKRTRRREWANKNQVRKAAARGRYGERDALETAAFRFLVAELGYEDATVIWTDLRPVLAKSMPEDRLLAVINTQLKTGRLLADPREIGGHVLGGHPFRVIELTTAIDEVRTAYRRLSNAKQRR